MTSAASLTTHLRADSGLSQRALAARAGCTRSTIVRVESGEMDPTVTMLARIAAAAGRRLTITADRGPDTPSLAALAADSSRDPDGRIDWTRLRALLDWLNLHPDDTPAAIADPPVRTGSDRLDNLLAGIAEKIADDAGTRRPTWTRAVEPLSATWHAPGTPRMKAVEAATAPSQLAQRNILIAEENLWRRRV